MKTKENKKNWTHANVSSSKQPTKETVIINNMFSDYLNTSTMGVRNCIAKGKVVAS